MNYLETEEFEERMRVVEHRAGHVAWQVLAAALIITLLIHERLTGESYNTLIYLIPYNISWLAYAIMRKRSGVDQQQIQEERRRLGRTGAGKRIIRRNMAEFVLMMSVVLVLIALGDMTEEGVWILVGFTAVIIVGIYLGMRHAYGLWPFRTAEDEAGEDAS